MNLEEKIKALAHEAKKENPYAAAILYALAGSMAAGWESEMCESVTKVVMVQIDRIKGIEAQQN